MRLHVRAMAASLAWGAWTLGSTPSVAHAFCRSTTVPIAPEFAPSPSTCWDQGVPLFWRSSCVSYGIQRDASRQIHFDTAASGISRAFAKWMGVSCPSGGLPSSRASIELRDLGPADCGEIAYDANGPNQNVIVFRDEQWPHSDSSSSLALTTLTFDPETGEIYDADMEINAHDQRITVGDPVPPDAYDFESIVTHETGHFLGLAHSGDDRATMYANYVPGSTGMRQLTADDVAGICSIYRPDGTRAVLGGATPVAECDPTPRRGYSSACAGDEEAGSSGCAACSLGSASTAVAAPWIALGLGLTAALARRRPVR